MRGHCSLGSGDWQTLRRAFSMRFGGEGFEHGPRRSERLIETASTGVPRGPPPPRPTSTPTTSPSTYRVRREVYTLYTGTPPRGPDPSLRNLPDHGRAARGRDVQRRWIDHCVDLQPVHLVARDAAAGADREVLAGDGVPHHESAVRTGQDEATIGQRDHVAHVGLSHAEVVHRVVVRPRLLARPGVREVRRHAVVDVERIAGDDSAREPDLVLTRLRILRHRHR